MVGVINEGAPNMLGEEKGMATLYKERQNGQLFIWHYLCHWLEVAFKYVMKGYLSLTREKLSNALYYFYRNSWKQRQQLYMAFQYLNIKGANPARAGGTRWDRHQNQ